MSSLFDFGKNFKEKDNNNKQNASNAENIKKSFPNMEAGLEKDLKDTFEKYENMDKDQLYGQLFQEAKKLKANGQFNYETLYNTIQNMGQYLSQEQKENMLRLLDQLR